MSFGKVSVCNLCMGKCLLKNYPDTNLSVKLSQRNCFKELYKRAMTQLFSLSIAIRNGKIVWKHGPNRPFYAFMLRTKLYQNPFFSTVHQNVNKPKSRAVRTVYGPIFLPFYVIIIRFFSFFCQYANNITGSNCDIIGCNLSKKKKKLALSQTQSGEPNYIDHKILL